MTEAEAIEAWRKALREMPRRVRATLREMNRRAEARRESYAKARYEAAIVEPEWEIFQ